MNYSLGFYANDETTRCFYMDCYRFSEAERAVLEQTPAPLAVYQYIDKRVIPLVLSEGFRRLFAYGNLDEAYHYMNRDMYKDTHPDDTARIAEAAWHFSVEDAPYDVIFRNRKQDGVGYHVIHATGKHIHTDTGARLAYVWYMDEGAYTEESDGQSTTFNRALNNALHEESILQANRYDYLTGLPSMTWFFELAGSRVDAMLRDGKGPAMLYLDFSGMKYYNTRYGFAEGDRLLRGFAKVLARIFTSENCCRFSADHFVAITHEEGLEERLNRLFEETKALNGGKSLSLHVGVYPRRIEPVPTSTACDRAKIACDALKNTYSSGYNFYTLKVRDSAEHRQHILATFDRALEEKWIQVYYQPIVRAVNGRVSDEEALARWIDPNRGFLSPADFIPILEETEQIYRLDLYVLETVLQKIKRLETEDIYVVPQSVNLSRSDFNACDIVEEICRRVDAAGVSRDKITIEITESTVGSDFNFMKAQIARFQALGFSVWMDDFGSGYSSLDVLQSIPFDLIKFDMSFMKKLDEGDSGKVILTELMRMATALGVDTVCEGVETEAQVRFLREIGCSKLQGYYFCKPIPLERILARYEEGVQIGFENPRESEYFEAIGRVNLYDLAVISQEESTAFQNIFNTLPMGIMEITGDNVRFARSNQSYRDFMKRYFGYAIVDGETVLPATPENLGAAFMKMVRQCCGNGNRAFYDEQMPDGSVVHAFARRIAFNPVTGAFAAAIAVLSITEPNGGATYASIARALAADYYNIYYVDMETDRFIEYTSPVGGEELAMERHGENFFEACVRDSYRIYEPDRELFFNAFSKEKILRELDRQGVFTATYRLMDTGTPMYVNMKVTRMQPDGRHIIMGISIVDSQMKQEAQLNDIRKERDTLARVMALSEDYLSLYTVHLDTGEYIEYNATGDYESLGFDKAGPDFFSQAVTNARASVYADDLPEFLERFTRENILEQIRREGSFRHHYRLVIQGTPRQVSLKIVPFTENDRTLLLVGVRAWIKRK